MSTASGAPSSVRVAHALTGSCPCASVHAEVAGLFYARQECPVCGTTWRYLRPDNANIGSWGRDVQPDMPTTTRQTSGRIDR